MTRRPNYCHSTANCCSNLPSTSCPSPQIHSQNKKAPVLCICLDFYTVNICPPLPSLKSSGWKDYLIFDLMPEHRNICHMLKTNAQNEQPQSFIYCARDLGVETNVIITRQLGWFCWEKGHLPCFAAAEQTSAVRSQAKGDAVVGYFLISSSNPAVQGLFMNRKHHC